MIYEWVHPCLTRYTIIVCACVLRVGTISLSDHRGENGDAAEEILLLYYYVQDQRRRLARRRENLNRYPYDIIIIIIRDMTTTVYKLVYK